MGSRRVVSGLFLVFLGLMGCQQVPPLPDWLGGLEDAMGEVRLEADGLVDPGSTDLADTVEADVADVFDVEEPDEADVPDAEPPLEGPAELAEAVDVVELFEAFDEGPCLPRECSPDELALPLGPCERLEWVPELCRCNPVAKSYKEACDDEDECTEEDFCDQFGECNGRIRECDDGNECTDDLCQAGEGCVTSNNKLSCDDGNVCTISDKCKDGECLGTASPLCLACDEADDHCETTYGDLAITGSDNLCNGVLTCVAGECVVDADTVVACAIDDDSECEKNTCAPDTGACTLAPVPEGTGCTDGNTCTKDDACVEGACEGVFDTSVAGCACNDDEACATFDNGNLCDGVLHCLDHKCLLDASTIPPPCDKSDDTACRRAQCQPSTGFCEPTALPTGTTCEDGNPCTLADVCNGGTCAQGNLNECKHLTGTCTVGQCLNLDGSCIALPRNEGVACTNDDRCAATARCSQGACLTTAEVSCDDGDACTSDTCEAATGACLRELVPTEAAETCNAADDDCDGLTDEEFAYEDPTDGSPQGLGAACDGWGLCGEGLVECAASGAVTCSSNPDGSAYDGSDEVCNGQDDDCDGSPDNGLSWLGALVGEECNGIGACGVGVVECVVERGETTCSTNPDGTVPESATEACNGQDDDCDGVTDEDLQPTQSTCRFVGVCDVALVVATCQGAEGWACDYANVPGYQAADETGACDGQDNDCDGQTDEDFASLGQACDSDDADACAGGTWACAADGQGVTCTNDVLTAEVCDGAVDEDCDGQTDEEGAKGCAWYQRDADADGYGQDGDVACLCAPDALTGYTATTGGDCDDTPGVGALANPEGVEVCNGVDDDCDGDLDAADGLDLVLNDGRACESALGVCGGSTKAPARCVGGAWLPCEDGDYLAVSTLYEAVAELTCDGQDNDCDGQTDEDFAYVRVDGSSALGLGQACGRGACEGGVTVCKADRTGVKCSTSGAASPEVCDGADDDCDGQTDADDADLATNDAPFCENQAGACEGARKPMGLCADGAWLPCETLDYAAQGASFEAEVELSCDGEDNDCDEAIDDDFELLQPDESVLHGVGKPCGVGACAGGQTRCDATGVALVCEAEAGIQPEVCDEIDNDCDGLTDASDPDLTGLPCVRQAGVCAGATRTPDLCQFGSWVPCGDDLLGAWSPDFEPAVESSCDGQDNDCDGSIDEDFVLALPGRPELRGVGVPCGLGACAGGVTACDPAGAALVCPTADDGTAEICDDQDDDCDGETDEGLDASSPDNPCRVVGVCSPSNVGATCAGGEWSCDYQAVDGYEADLELTCDGQDNDCDGETDEDAVDGEGKHKGDACERSGCVGGVVVCDPANGQAACSLDLGGSFEACDGLDNDCDGETDEGLAYVDPVSSAALALGQVCHGVGACGEGLVECGASGAITCSTNPDGSAPANTLEACNGQDDDCDGVVDDGLAWNGLGLGVECDGTGACGLGLVECSSDGAPTCSTNPNGSAVGASVEACNGQDDDCDGSTDALDPDLLRAACEKNAGACAGALKPAALCVAGAWRACTDADYLAQGTGYEMGVEATCDGQDNDCDGDTDEDFSLTGPSGAVYTGLGRACGVGACAGGATVCRTDQAGIRCTTHALASTETCNGQDDDCDGQTDADDAADLAQYDRRACEKTVGACAGATKPVALCSAGHWAPCGVPTYEANNPLYEDGVEALCDGVDNDCDGVRDDDFTATLPDGSTVVGVNKACGRGACAGGLTACNTAGDGIACASADLAAYEVCDGVDNDCDGLLDAADEADLEAHDAQPCAKQAGVCAGARKLAVLCEEGVWGECTAATYAAQGAAYQAGVEATCDALDNDCDGATDEDFALTGPSGTQYTGVGAACGVGVCNGGATACRDDQQGITCSTYASKASEICDGQDNDCDGRTDAADAADLSINDGRPCEKQSGVCNGAQKPVSACRAGTWTPCETAAYEAFDAAYEAEVEAACDAKDNDCDGGTDEDFSLALKNGALVQGVHAACGVGVCAGGLTACNASGTGIACPSEESAGPETCNAADDDCDGLEDAADPDLPTTDPQFCARQSGVCLGSRKPVALCVDGAWGACGSDLYAAFSTSYQAGVEASCDGKDNDCDGAADEDFSVTGPSGTVYAGVGLPCGVGKCAGGSTVCTADKAGVRCTSFDMIALETCNGVDDDCDNLKDAADGVDLLANDPQPCEKQQGVCVGARKPAALCKQSTWSACSDDTYGTFTTDYEATSETRCDGRDNDCDGTVDEEMPDTDGDTLSDCVDTDDDADGLLDADDNCPLVTNPTQADLDVDDAGDACDDDLDGDGSANVNDCAPSDPARYAGAPETCNGVDDDCDALTDAADAADLVLADARACENQAGVCAGSTKPAALCVAGAWQACASGTYRTFSEAYEAAGETRCDGKDNDCSGQVDEDFSYLDPVTQQQKAKGDPCGTGACVGGQVVCNAAFGALMCSTDTGVGFEKCDGIDNDCDGKTDAVDAADLLASDRQLCAKQQGVCSGAQKAVSMCVNGAWQDCTDATYLAFSTLYQVGVEASCDGADNDCDGSSDEDFQATGPSGTVYVGVGASCGSGACVGGQMVCKADRSGTTCTSWTNASNEVCNNVDDDCDGKKDNADTDDLVGGFLRFDQPTCANQKGLCLGTKKPARLCANGAWAECTDTELFEQRPDYEASLERSCDGQDNDCSGDTDEDFSVTLLDGTLVVGAGKACGAGACQGGQSECTPAGSGIACSTEGELASPETCDGLDDDCDGATDAADAADLLTYDLEGCEKQQGVCAGSAKPAELCADGSWQPCTAAEYGDAYEEPTETSCDEQDNDCDGSIDDDFQTTLPDGSAKSGVGVGCGVGACSGGVTECRPDGSGTRCSSVAVASTEICDGVDNDCDGKIDAADTTDLDALGYLNGDKPLCELQAGVCGGSRKKAALCVGGLWTACSTAVYVAHQASYTANAETACDGADNDCDGNSDEDFSYVGPSGATTAGVGAPCGVGSCAGGLTLCRPDQGGTTCSTLGNLQQETCDGVDNDCDGSTDAADTDDVVAGYLLFDKPACANQDGVCVGAKRPAALCVDGAWQTCTDGVYLAWADTYQSGRELSCDGLDNDCSGAADEDFSVTGPSGAVYAGVGTTCGVGACASGLTRCATGGTGTECSTHDRIAAETCNGADDDCDGKTDAADPTDLLTHDARACELTLGVCAGVTKPAALCQGAAGWASCTGSTYGPAYETGAETRCDDQDNDCNGQVDEDFSWTEPDGATVRTGVGATCGLGVCGDGLTQCSGSTAITCSTATASTPELCNGADDDCDGRTDADDATDLLAADLRACELQLGVCSGKNKPVTLCNGAAGWGVCTPAEYGASYDGAAEVRCDGKDNDCSGQVDEDFPYTAPSGTTVYGLGTACGTGKCAGGTTQCTGAGTAMTCTTAGSATNEVCNGVDDDCDGASDRDDATDLLAYDLRSCELTKGVCSGKKKPAALCNGSAGWGTCTPAEYGPDYDGAAEVRCDGKDNDCNDVIDEDFSWTEPDGSTVRTGINKACGFGVCSGGLTVCTAATTGLTCSTATQSIPEVCNGDDDDCDASTDEGVKLTFYADSDTDTYGNAAVTVQACSAPAGHVANAIDCDDTRGAVNPGANEICNSLDDDCDGSNDEGWPDKGAACTMGLGVCLASGQRVCDVANPAGPTVCSAVAGTPGTEGCNDLDDDCDGSLDDGCDDDNDDRCDVTMTTTGAPTACPQGGGDCADTDPNNWSMCLTCGDLDGDGFFAACDAYVTFGGPDCNDGDGDNWSANACNQCRDSDTDTWFIGCDRYVTRSGPDCDDADVGNWSTCGTCKDADGDGYYVGCALYTSQKPGPDCNDGNPGVSPGVTETVSNDVDENCDGSVLCWVDEDNDGYGTAATTLVTLPATCTSSLVASTVGGGAIGLGNATFDCADAEGAIRPGVSEFSGDSVDQDCNGQEICFQDADDDGYRPDAVSTVVSSDADCDDAFEATAADPATDCNDQAYAVRPDATETCNDLDDDCDGAIDEGVKLTFFRDADVDGYGDPASTTEACAAPIGYLANAADCDDTRASVNPAGSEICNGLDDDCDGFIDEGVQSTFYLDGDGDTYGVSTTVLACAMPSGYATRPGDCDDTAANVNPGAFELVGNGVDNDCDGAETCYMDTDDDGYRPDDASTVASADADCDDSGEALEWEQVGDCDDTTHDVNPGVDEVIGNGRDDDCTDGELCFRDGDGDGFLANFGTAIISVDGDCDDGLEALASDPLGDCNDSSYTIHPFADESVGDGVDRDCDGTELCYLDVDDDGYRPTGYDSVASDDLDCDDSGEAWSFQISGDCQDDNPLVKPYAQEACNGADDDCDGTIDDGWTLKGTACDSGDGDFCANGAFSCGSNAVAFDGTDDYVQVPGNAFTTLTSATVEGWVRFDDFAQSWSPIFSLGQTPTAEPGYALVLGHNGTDSAPAVRLFASGSATMEVNGPGGSLVAGRWHHVAFTCGSAGANLFLDGTNVAASSSTLCLGSLTDQSSAFLGRSIRTGDGLLKGAVQWVRVSDTVRYTNTTPFTLPLRQPTVDSHTVALWALNDGSGVTVLDYAPDKRHGTLMNGAAWTTSGQSTVVCATETVLDKTETCDGTDDDCDGSLDAADPSLVLPACESVAGVCAGCSKVASMCAGGVWAGCADGASPRYLQCSGLWQQNEATCDNDDNDCDGALDEGCDDDSDGWCDQAMTVTDFGHATGGGSWSSVWPTACAYGPNDCNDTTNAIRPDANEGVNDGVDQNCDGAETCYKDADNDGYRPNASALVTSIDLDCLDPNEAVASDPTGDCNDGNAAFRPNATEVPGDNVDQDCNNVETCYRDADNDGYRPDATSIVSFDDTDCNDLYEAVAGDPTGDCDDHNAAVRPNATEVPSDNVDQNCDGYETCYKDADNDGYRPDATSTVSSTDTDCNDPNEAKSSDPTTDCNDSVATTHPDAALICDNVDNDCDGTTDEHCDDDGDDYCDNSFGYGGWPSAPAVCPNGPNDCRDMNSAIHPGADEVPNDNVDQNCDGGETCYKDADNDHYRPDATSTVASSDMDCNDSGEAWSNDLTGDCNDDVVFIHPGVAESPGDSVDENCDGYETCYKDADNDGYRPDPTSTVSSTDTDCNDPNEATNSDPITDCNDSVATTHPGAGVICDGVDNDCDGEIDEFCDDDGDDYCNGIYPIVGNPAICPNGGSDCFDSASVGCSVDRRPGQAGYFSVSCGSSFDYNCDGTSEKHWGTAWSACVKVTGTLICTGDAFLTVPACGKPGTFRDCDYSLTNLACYYTDYLLRKQECR